MNNKVFMLSDLCDMVRSQKFANELERETGIESGWHENVNNPHLALKS